LTPATDATARRATEPQTETRIDPFPANVNAEATTAYRAAGMIDAEGRTWIAVTACMELET
jgi:hypothetical protein